MIFKNTKQQGDASLGVAIAWFTQQGWTVCIPLTDSQDYDLVVEMNGELKKIQVKTSNFARKPNRAEIELRVLGGNSKKNFVHKLATDCIYDYLFAVTTQGNFLIPKTEFENTRSSLTLSNTNKWKNFNVENFVLVCDELVSHLPVKQTP